MSMVFGVEGNEVCFFLVHALKAIVDMVFYAKDNEVQLEEFESGDDRT